MVPWPVVAQGETRAPIPIRQHMLLTPEATAGTGLAPEVKVAVKVDPTGRVAKVEVLEIKPTSEHDELFRQGTIDNISAWRYAPALKNGEPVEATLKWSVQYRAKLEGSINAFAEDPFEEAERPDYDAIRREHREKHHQKLIERYSKSAEAQMDPTHRRRFDSPRFIVVTDAEEPTTAEIVATNLEATYSLLDSLFQPNLEAIPASFKTVVYLFRQRSTFAQAATGLQVPSWPTGVYKSPGFLMFHLEVGSSENLLHGLIHEAFHAYAGNYLMRPGLRLPRWMGEGFAEYISNSQIKKGKLIPGKTLRTTFSFRHNLSGVYRRTTRAGFALNDLKKAIRKSEAVSVGDLLREDTGIFYGAKGHLYYPTAWLFVHFLRHGQPEWETEQFPALLLYLVENYPPEEALQALYGATPTELDEQFRSYVGKL